MHFLPCPKIVEFVPTKTNIWILKDLLLTCPGDGSSRAFRFGTISAEDKGRPFTASLSYEERRRDEEEGLPIGDVVEKPFS
jgi:hypothetical protein